MTITDIITLAKQGYKPSDIKDLIELTRESDQRSDNDSLSKKDPEQDLGNTGPDPEPDSDEEEKTAVEDKTDYKKLYEDLKKETQWKNVRENSQQEEKKETTADVLRKLL